MTKSKLTLSLDPAVVRAARRLAAARNTSVSALFSCLIESLQTCEREPSIGLGPLTRQASGIVSLPERRSDRDLLTEALLDKRKYMGLVHKETDSDYGVSFPDLPGCITAGRTIEEAGEMAAEALALHIEGLAEDGGEIPVPSSADAVLAHPDAADALALLVVEPLPARAETPVSR